MKNTASWITVMRRELVVRGLNKLFLIMTGVTAALLSVGITLLIVFSRSSADPIAATNDQAAAVITAMNKQVTDTGKQAPYEIKQVDGLAEAEKLLANGKVKAVLHHNDGSWQYVVREFNPRVASEQTKVKQSVSAYMVAMNAAAKGVDFASLTQGSEVQTRALDGGNKEKAGASFFLGIGFGVLFFIVALIHGLQIAQSVVEEKQSRIVEILITAIPVRHLLVGKIVGNALLAFGQLLLFVSITLVGTAFTDLSIVLPSLRSAIAWFVVFFVVGFIALSCVWAAAGSMATRQEDLSQLTMPLTMVLMASYIAVFVATGPVRVVLSYVPILSSTMMPIRIMNGDAAWWEVVISLSIVIIFSLAAIIVGERIYRRGILQTKLMGLKSLVKG